MIWVRLFLLLFFLWPLLLLSLSGKMGWRSACDFTCVQLAMWWATVLGYFLLIYPCLKQAWVADQVSNNTVRTGRTTIDRFTWNWLNDIWGNPEDGVSGRYALLSDGTPYMPTGSPAWRAYSWSALRNSCDALKYVFAWSGGPLVTFWFFGTRHAGWRPMPQLKGSPSLPVLG